MDLAGYVINAVLVEGRSVKEVCEAHDISRSWLYELIARYRELGDDGLKPQSKRPRSSPTRVAPTSRTRSSALRKELTDLGVDAGAHTIHYHLQRRHRRRRRAVPSVATIWRVLSRRGFVIPQPHKRPKSSWRRFQAELPNECWQADTTHWAARRRHRRRDPQHHRRPLPPSGRLPGVRHGQGRRRGRDLPPRRRRSWACRPRC